MSETVDHTRLVTDDRIRELSELDHKTTQDIVSSAKKLEQLRGIAQTIHRAVLEYRGLREQFNQVACDYHGTSLNDPANRNGALATAVGNDPSGIQLSWDYETGEKPSYDQLLNDAETLGPIIARFEAELKIKEENLQQIRHELSQLNESEQKDVESEPHYVNLADLDQNKRNDLANGNGLTTLDNTQDLEDLAKLQHARIEELLEKISELENCLNTVKKQKDELLRVNHQWDEQYRLLKEDLTQQLQGRNATEVLQRSSSDDSSAAANALQTQIMKLNKEKDLLARELASMREQQEKTDNLWSCAKAMITQEREAKHAAVEQVKAVQERYNAAERELMKEKEARACLKQEIERLVSSEQRDCASISSLSPNVKDQIEMLKQQIRVYADDFANERSDRERIQGDREELKEKVKTCEGEIELLQEQIRVYQQDFLKERSEKDRLLRHIRAGGSSVNIVQDEPWIVVPPNEYSSVQRRQPRTFERNERKEWSYRGNTNFTPREIQEYAYQQQLQSQGRAPGHLSGLCHDCEVDGHDVIDGSVGSHGQAALKCPRCARQFPVKERRAFDDHVEKCTI